MKKLSILVAAAMLSLVAPASAAPSVEDVTGVVVVDASAFCIPVNRNQQYCEVAFSDTTLSGAVSHVLIHTGKRWQAPYADGVLCACFDGQERNYVDKFSDQNRRGRSVKVNSSGEYVTGIVVHAPHLGYTFDKNSGVWTAPHGASGLATLARPVALP